MRPQKSHSTLWFRQLISINWSWCQKWNLFESLVLTCWCLLNLSQQLRSVSKLTPKSVTAEKPNLWGFLIVLSTKRKLLIMAWLPPTACHLLCFAQFLLLQPLWAPRGPLRTFRFLQIEHTLLGRKVPCVPACSLVSFASSSYSSLPALRTSPGKLGVFSSVFLPDLNFWRSRGLP